MATPQAAGVPTLVGGGHTTVSRRRFGSKAERRMRPVPDGCRFGASRTTYSGLRFPATGAGDWLQARAVKGIFMVPASKANDRSPLRLADRRGAHEEGRDAPISAVRVAAMEPR